MTPALCLTQRLDALVDGIEEAADKAGVEVFLETEIEQHVERVAPALAGDVGDRAVGEPGILGLDRRGDDDAVPVSLEHRSRLRLCADSARNRSRKLGSRNTAFSCSRSIAP